MPRGNGTGPTGMGLKTGRGAGYCADYDVPGYHNPLYGSGRAFFYRGGGRGYRNRFYSTGLPRWARDGSPAFGRTPCPPAMAASQEKDLLKKQADFLASELNDVRQRIMTLGKAEEQEK